jgi:HlyD family secretion protein
VNRFRPIIVAALIIAAAVAAWLLLSGPARTRTLSGYIEGDNLFLSSPIAGTVRSVGVVEGTRVAAGQQLFTIDPATRRRQTPKPRALR